MKKDQRGIIRNRVFIDQRPKVINEGLRIGDWETDTIEGKEHKNVLVSITECVSRILLLRHVSSKFANEMSQAILSALAPYLSIRACQIYLFCNGKEFALHHLIARKRYIPTFFTHPYSAWEKGTIERLNKDVRYYIPKKTPSADDILCQIPLIENKINHLPRKVFGYLSLSEFLFYVLSNQNILYICTHLKIICCTSIVEFVKI